MNKLNFRNDFLPAVPRILSKMNKFTILGEEGTSVLAGILSCLDLNLKIWLLWIEKYHGPQRKPLGQGENQQETQPRHWWEVSALALTEPSLPFQPTVAYSYCV